MSVLSEHVEQTRQKAGTGLPVLPRVNLLPPEIAETARFRRITYGLGGGLLCAVGVVALLFVAASSAVSEAGTEVQTATAQNTALKAETARFADVEAVYGRAAAAQTMLTTAMGEEVRYSQYLNDLSRPVPENVWVKNVTFAQVPAPAVAGSTAPGIGTVTFTGVGFKHDDVAVWLDSLAKQKGYVNPYFTSSTRALLGNRKIVNFTSTVTMTSEALSGRYTKPLGG